MITVRTEEVSSSKVGGISVFPFLKGEKTQVFCQASNKSISAILLESGKNFLNMELG